MKRATTFTMNGTMSGWHTRPLGQVADVIMGNSPPGDSYNEDGHGTPLINGPVEFSEGAFGHTIKSKYTTAPTKMCKKGDLLICVRGSTTGRTNIAAFDACIGRGVAAIRARLHQGYINHFVRTLEKGIHASGKGSTFPSVSQDQLDNLQVPLPHSNDEARSVQEQKRIADILDKADAVRRKRREAPSRLTSLIDSQFLTLFGDPLTNPKRWTPGTFNDHLTLVQYGPRFFNESYSSDGIRIVRITDLDQQGRLNYSAMPRMTVSDKDKETFSLRIGDLLLARSGATVGKTALIDEEAPECIAGAYFIRLRFTDKVRPLFAQMVLRSKPVQKIIAERSRQSAQQNFNGPAIRALPLPAPPTELQDDFVSFHRTAIESGKRLADAADQVDGLFNSLVQRAFRGEL